LWLKAFLVALAWYLFSYSAVLVAFFLPLKRLIQKVILDPLADKMIRGQIKDGDKVKIAFSNAKPVISVA
jgi:hypothetical protein